MCSAHKVLKAVAASAALAILAAPHPDILGSPMGELMKRLMGQGSTEKLIDRDVRTVKMLAGSTSHIERTEGQVLSLTLRGRQVTVDELLASSLPAAHKNDAVLGNVHFIGASKYRWSHGPAFDNVEPAPHVYLVAPPDEASFARVFSGTYNRAYVRELEAAKSALRNTRGNLIHAKVDDGKAAFEEALRSTHGEIISIIGHNEGGFFKFLNGETVHLAELAAICRTFKKKCVFFSCDAQSVFRKFRVDNAIGANTQLNYQEAARAAVALDEFLAQGRRLSDSEFRQDIPNVIDQAVADQHMSSKLTVVVIGGATAAVVVTLDAKRPRRIRSSSL